MLQGLFHEAGAERQLGTMSCTVRANFAIVSGDVNPAHLDPAYAETDLFNKVIAHGMWGGALISAVLGTELPGPGTIYLAQDLRFLAPVGIGDSAMQIKSVANAPGVIGATAAATSTQQMEKAVGGGRGSSGSQGIAGGKNAVEKGRAMPAGL